MNGREKSWIMAAGIRAVKTMAQTAAAAFMSDVEWKIVVSTSVLAGILSLLTSVAGLPEVEK